MVHELNALKLAIFKLAALQHFSPQHASIEPAPSSTLQQVAWGWKRDRTG
jgi:hypothetical protein